MRYQEPVYRPPSEARSYILQATIGCSWNHCTYCAMYRNKTFQVRPLSESLEDLELASRVASDVDKIFVADGDALILPMDHWRAILENANRLFPRLRRVSCYAMARNVIDKSQAELDELRRLGLTMLYIGPESGDDPTLKRIAKGATFADHVEAANKARAAGIELSVIALLGIAMERSRQHAEATARLITEMDPRFFSALTVTVVPETPLATQQARGTFELPSITDLLGEMRTMVAEAEPTESIFRTNHASNHLPLAGRLPTDRDRIIATIDGALAGAVPLRPEWIRGI